MDEPSPQHTLAPQAGFFHDADRGGVLEVRHGPDPPDGGQTERLMYDVREPSVMRPRSQNARANAYVAMLRAHFAAPDRMISATKLAQAAGYAGYEGSNLHYGKLGWRVAQEVGFVPPKRSDGTPIWTCAIARDRAVESEASDEAMMDALSRAVEPGHCEWEMRPQVVEALKVLGW